MNISGKFDASTFIEKHRQTLKFKKKEIIWLYALSKTENVFNSNQSVEFQIIRIYLKCLWKLTKSLKKSNSSFKQQAKILTDLALDRNCGYPENNRFFLKGFIGKDAEMHIYRHIFARAECLVRKKLGLRIRMNPEYFSPITEIQSSFNSHLGGLIHDVLNNLMCIVEEVDDQTELMLNQLDKNRWKEQLKQISKQYCGCHDLRLFCEAIDRLVHLNKKNINKHLIYYDTAKVMISYSRYEALRFYLHYVYESIDIADVKPLNASMRKKLLFDTGQIEAFERIVSNLYRYRSFDAALDWLKDFCIQN